uniref:Uncharacterized protein n=1 Tax=Anopheles atroparvus TaxID=41427 RepID=A0AAG5D4I2_ANOAO
MYCDIRSQFIPSISTGSAFVRNSCSISTASRMMLVTRSRVGFCTRYLNIRQAKSQCRPSSREISSFEKVKPGIRPRFFSQKMAAKLPLKKMPSTAANATTRSPKLAFLLEIQFSAQSAFFFTHGSVSMALNRNSLRKVMAQEKKQNHQANEVGGPNCNSSLTVPWSRGCTCRSGANTSRCGRFPSRSGIRRSSALRLPAPPG